MNNQALIFHNKCTPQLRMRCIPLKYNTKIPLKNSKYKTQLFYKDEELYNNNIGIRTGNGLCVLDLDKGDIIDEWLQHHTIFNISLPNTYTVKTRKGYHLYYSYDEIITLPTRLNFNNQGIDIKSGVNGYVVGAYSVVDDVQYIPNSLDIQYLTEEFINLLKNNKRNNKKLNNNNNFNLNNNKKDKLNNDNNITINIENINIKNIWDSNFLDKITRRQKDYQEYKNR